MRRDKRIIHGMRQTPTYNSWYAMKQRCIYKKSVAYDRYGGRGITVCYKWLNFKGFYEDMGIRPDNKTLDRIDNDKGYNKENCRWATRKEQSNNKRNTKFFLFKGERLTITQIASIIGITPEGTWYRIKNKLPIDGCILNIKNNDV